MADINISFHPEMQAATLAGRKICTTRPEKKGEPGDCFQVGDYRYRLVDVEPCQLCDVAEELYRFEGFKSTIQFADFWSSIYGKFEYGLEVFVHWYAAVLDIPYENHWGDGDPELRSPQ